MNYLPKMTSSKIQLFIAIPIPAETCREISSLHDTSFAFFWKDAFSYHITLRFIGTDIDISKLNDIKSSLAKLRFNPFTLQLQGVEKFESSSDIILWAGVSKSPELTALKNMIDDIINGLKFSSISAKSFIPHVTVAKAGSTDRNSTLDYLRKNKSFSSKPFKVNHFNLYQSFQDSAEPYHLLHSFNAS